ncbi:MAG: hypothetical protein QMD43_06615 [Thermodesulfovibrio sp.]|jgi:CRISPR-associated protein Csx10|uniref:RAMP superfamily CRISPR-associated protein n=1 Tax=Thermodesulfovibrio sp. N1 TaxID=1871110 RepID=UPI00083B0D5C|nr:RAMP superfamily CRISPR-associated protein [Thermodesulfovibrio sp. N1]MDI6714680.1 hypothetical protein [Thermodesulfovibrio sp.]ODA44129.1 DUF324 domain-containing protein [Thermodesulfovibrio sp. N1]
MQAIRYLITSLSPLLFSSNTGDPNMVSTLDYIPGTHLKGLFANEYIRRRGLGAEAHKDETFYRWFLRGELKITNAYIVQKKYEKVYRLLPIPQSIQKEKGKNDTAYDLLLHGEEFDIQTTGIVGYGRLSDKILHKKSVKKSLNFHHARDRKRGVSKEGQIFNYESIDEGQIFEGLIIGKSNDLKEFTLTIPNGIYYLGRSRNNQYGKIRFEIVSQESEDFTSEINIEQKPEENVVLTLLSDTIIYNENGYSTTNIEDMEKELKCKIKRAFIKQTEQEGFISVWRLKTPSEVCFKAGSCFLLENTDMEKLMELQKRGIGMKTHEGFGRFVIGWQNEEQLKVVEEKDEEKISKPEQPMSEKVNELIKTIIKEQIKNKIQTEAIKNAEEFKNIPSKSLLAKLESSVREGSFKNLIENLKNTARENLERCQNKETDLLDFLRNFSINQKEMTKIIKENGMEKLCKEISYESDNDEDFRRELEKIYLMTFLSNMRKKAKQEGEK